jgi:hypothetical protein
MGKCKVRVRRLTMAPGALGDAGDEDDGDEAEARQILAEGSDSETDSDGDEIDRLSCSLHKMSISSPSGWVSVESRAKPHRPVSAEVNSLSSESRCDV